MGRGISAQQREILAYIEGRETPHCSVHDILRDVYGLKESSYRVNFDSKHPHGERRRTIRTDWHRSTVSSANRSIRRLVSRGYRYPKWWSELISQAA